MSYRYITRFTASPVNWTNGRQGHQVEAIAIHHWGASRGLFFSGIVKFLCGARPANPTSAHYVAQGTARLTRLKSRQVACIVATSDTAYAVGDWLGNLTTISIECRPYPTAEDYDLIGELVADLWHHYGRLPLRPHNYYSATECPGSIDLRRIERAAEIWYAKKGHTGGGGGTTAPAPKPDRKPEPGPGRGSFPLPAGHAYAVDDGTRYTHSGVRRRDRNEVRLIQRLLGMRDADGRYGPRTRRRIRRFQSNHGLTVDGQVGPATWAKLMARRRRSGFPFPLRKGHAYAVDDGTQFTHSGARAVDRPNVRLIQREVGVSRDGIFGHRTASAVRDWQRGHGLAPDGQVGNDTWRKMF